MTIRITIRPQFHDAYTGVVVDGEWEESLINVLVSSLVRLDAEVLMETGDGELIPYEDWEYEDA